MANTRTFVEHALELLSLLGPVQARAMFGGHGLYADGVMFGLLDDDEIFLKTDEETRPRFLAERCRMWIYPGMMETHYYRPPDGAHEDAEAMLPWAALALEVAVRARAAKAAKARTAADRKAARGRTAKRERKRAGREAGRRGRGRGGRGTR